MDTSATAHRILIVVSNLGTGGAEWQSMHLAKGLAARGHRVTIAALGEVRAPVEPLRAAGVRVLRLHAVGPRARLAALPSLVRLARRQDVVHCRTGTRVSSDGSPRCWPGARWSSPTISPTARTTAPDAGRDALGGSPHIIASSAR